MGIADIVINRAEALQASDAVVTGPVTSDLTSDNTTPDSYSSNTHVRRLGVAGYSSRMYSIALSTGLNGERLTLIRLPIYRS